MPKVVWLTKGLLLLLSNNIKSRDPIVSKNVAHSQSPGLVEHLNH